MNYAILVGTQDNDDTKEVLSHGTKDEVNEIVRDYLIKGVNPGYAELIIYDRPSRIESFRNFKMESDVKEEKKAKKVK